jgi:hypothetical protein
VGQILDSKSVHTKVSTVNDGDVFTCFYILTQRWRERIDGSMILVNHRWQEQQPLLAIHPPIVTLERAHADGGMHPSMALPIRAIETRHRSRRRA